MGDPEAKKEHVGDDKAPTLGPYSDYTLYRCRFVDKDGSASCGLIICAEEIQSVNNNAPSTFVRDRNDLVLRWLDIRHENTLARIDWKTSLLGAQHGLAIEL